MITVTVVVPVLNAARTLPACLEGLARLDPAPGEIILVDNGSTDESLPVLRAFSRNYTATDTRVLQEPRPGAAAARNAGIRDAKGDLIAFTDADCAPESTWLRYLIDPFADPTTGAVAGRVVAAPTASTLELFSALYTLQSSESPAQHQRWTPWAGGYPTANLAMRRELLLELRGFDERLGNYGEDYDLCARLYGRGFSLLYRPAARVAHYHRTTLIGMLRQAFGFGRGHPYLLRNHGGRGLWLELPRNSRAWPGCPIQAWVDLASADKKALSILAAGIFCGPACWLLPMYAIWLSVVTNRRAQQAGSPVSPVGAGALAGLLLAKSAAMTLGRWYGSVKYGALCF